MKKGWNQKLMLSLYKKEASYGAAVTNSASNFSSITGHSNYDPEWNDSVENDKDSVSGTEHGTDQDILSQGFKVQLEQSRSKPNFLIGMVAAALGNIVSTQDGSYTAYKHYITPIAVGSSLPSFNLVGLKGGLQYLHKGCMVNSLSLSAEEGKAVSCSADIIGSGDRAVDANSFVAEPLENWILAKNGYCWLEGASISIDAANTQGLENISSGTPTDLKSRISKFSWKWNNNIQGFPGFGAGNGGVFQDMDYGRRTTELSFSLRFDTAAELAYYTANTALAIEFEFKGASLIAAGGTFYPGFSLVVPRFKLKKPPLPKGGVGDILTCDFEGDVEEDGTNPVVKFTGYNAKAAYFAA